MVPGGFSQAVVAYKSQAVTKLKKKYLWSWAIAGVTIPLLLLVIWRFIPKPPGWNPSQAMNPVQQRFADAAVVLWPAKYVGELLGLAVTDAGGDPSAALPSTIIITVSILMNAALYLGIGLVLWTFGSRFFQRHSPN